MQAECRTFLAVSPEVRVREARSARRKPMSQLVGTKGFATRPVREQAQLLFLDTVLHLTASAVILFIEFLGRAFGRRDVGDHEAWVGPFREVFRFTDHSPLG